MNSIEDDANDDAYLAGPVPLPQEEGLDEEEVGLDLDQGYSPAERPRGITAWGTTEREDIVREDVATRLRNEQAEVRDEGDGDGIGDNVDSDGEPIDDQVGDMRAGRLVFDDLEPSEPNQEYWAVDVGIDGGAASAEEAAIHLIPDDEPDGTNYPERIPVRRKHTGRGNEDDERNADVLDELAAFLMHHAYDPGVNEADRLQIFAIVKAHQEGDDPATVERIMRDTALPFRDRAEYRHEWRPREGPQT